MILKVTDGFEVARCVMFDNVREVQIWNVSGEDLDRFAGERHVSNHVFLHRMHDPLVAWKDIQHGIYRFDWLEDGSVPRTLFTDQAWFLMNDQGDTVEKGVALHPASPIPESAPKSA